MPRYAEDEQRQGRYGRGDYENEGGQWEENEDRRGGGSRRGFGAMDREGRASSRSQGRDEYGEFEGEESEGRRGGWEEEEDYGRGQRGGRFENEGEWEEEEDYGGREGRGRRGFAGMDPVERREIASRGGRASSHIQGRGEYGQFEGEDEGYEGRGNRGRGGWEEEEEGHRQRGGRGFASMDLEERRELASRGGRASSHSQARDEYGHFAGEGNGRSRSRGGSESRSRGGGGSRRGFAAMSQQQRRKIAAMGGHASHRG